MTFSLKPYRNAFIFIIFGLISYGLRLYCCQHPDFVESFYSKGVFQWIRKSFYWFSYIPFPPFYLFFVLVMGWLIRIIFMKEHLPFKKTIFVKMIKLLGFIALLYGLFLWSWGYNYCRIPIESHFQITEKSQNESVLRSELEFFTKKLIKYRQDINPDLNANISLFDPMDYENIVKKAVRKSLAKFDYPTSKDLNVRFLKPKGALMIWSTAGIYFPFVGESNVDAGLHPLQQIYVMAHELGHGYGFGDEGTCNFISYLASENTNNPLIRYACLLGYWRTLAVNYKMLNSHDYAIFRKALPFGIIQDLDEINDTINSYPEILPSFRHLFYNQYLKAQGISEGMENYNRVVMLVTNWRKSQLFDNRIN